MVSTRGEQEEPGHPACPGSPHHGTGSTGAGPQLSHSHSMMENSHLHQLPTAVLSSLPVVALTPSPGSLQLSWLDSPQRMSIFPMCEPHLCTRGFTPTSPSSHQDIPAHCRSLGSPSPLALPAHDPQQQV